MEWCIYNLNVSWNYSLSLWCFKLHTVPCLTSSKDIRGRRMVNGAPGAGGSWSCRCCVSSRSWASWVNRDTLGWGSWQTRCRHLGSSLLCPPSPQSSVTWPDGGTECCNPGGAQTHVSVTTYRKKQSLGFCEALCFPSPFDQNHADSWGIVLMVLKEKMAKICKIF